MLRNFRIFRGRLLPLTISLIAGAGIGLAIAGIPSSNALTDRGGAPDLTVKPGALIDPADLTVPPLLTIPGPVPPAPVVPDDSSSTSTPDSALRSRADIVVMVSNGNGGKGLARSWADRALALGYPDPDLSTVLSATDTVVYYAPGYEGEAQRLASELATTMLEIKPLASAPVTSPAFTGQLLVVLGKNVPTLRP